MTDTTITQAEATLSAAKVALATFPRPRIGGDGTIAEADARRAARAAVWAAEDAIRGLLRAEIGDGPADDDLG